MPLCLWLSQKGPSTDIAASNPMPGGWGRDRPPGGPRTRVAMQKSPRAQGAGKRHFVPAEIHGQTSMACGRRFGGVHRWMATACNGCMASRRDGPPGGRTLPTPACRGPFQAPGVSPCFRGIHGAKIGDSPSPPVRHLCLSERAWNGRMPSASEAASRPSAQDIRFYASFADAVERWEPENFYCKTDARERDVPSRRAPSAVLQGFSGPPANAAGSALFSALERFSFATGPGEGSVARGQTRKRENTGAGRPAAAVTVCTKIDQYAQKLTMRRHPVPAHPLPFSRNCIRFRGWNGACSMTRWASRGPEKGKA